MYRFTSGAWAAVQDGNIPTLLSTAASLESSVATLTYGVGANSAAITTEESIRATQTGSLAAEYVVALDVGGHIAGYKLTNLGGGTGSSNFSVVASSFGIYNPDTGAVANPFLVDGTGTYIDHAIIREVDAGAIMAGTITAALTIESPTITGGGLYINSGIGMRYVDDNHVLTLTGGSDNGVAHGAQLDLAGNGASSIAGDAVLSAGNVSGGSVRLRTGSSIDALILDDGQNATFAQGIYTGSDIHLGTVQGVERWIYDYLGNHVLRARYSTTPTDLASVIDLLSYHGLCP